MTTGQETRNRALECLPPAEFERFSRDFELVEMTRGRDLDPSHDLNNAVYFPISGMVSLVMELEDSESIECATVGTEGVVGIDAVLGAAIQSLRPIVQIPGQAYKVRITTLQALEERVPAFRSYLLSFANYLLGVVAQSVACNAYHPLEARAARWLLTTEDAARSSQFELTHEFLSHMLGAQRPTVTAAARTLQAKGAIQYRYGRVSIVNRDALLAISCECYWANRMRRKKLLDEAGTFA